MLTLFLTIPHVDQLHSKYIADKLYVNIYFEEFSRKCTFLYSWFNQLVSYVYFGFANQHFNNMK